MEAKIAWAAGLFEGEGTIIIRTRPEDQIDVQLGMTDKDVVDRFCEIVGVGKVHGPYQYGTRKPFWKFVAYGAEAMVVIHTLRDYFGVRRGAKADEAVGRYLARQERPHYTVSRKGMGGRPTHRRTPTNDLRNYDC